MWRGSVSVLFQDATKKTRVNMDHEYYQEENINKVAEFYFCGEDPEVFSPSVVLYLAYLTKDSFINLRLHQPSFSTKFKFSVIFVHCKTCAVGQNVPATNNNNKKKKTPQYLTIGCPKQAGEYGFKYVNMFVLIV